MTRVGVVRMLIVDDASEVRELLALAAGRRPGLEVVGTAGTGAEGVQEAARLQPDLVLLDIGLPAGDATVVMQRLRSIASLACVPVIIVTAREADSVEQRMLDAGAQGFFQKPPDKERLLTAIRDAIGPGVATDAP